MLVDAVTRIPNDVWGDAILYIFGGNLEHQPEDFQAAVKELFRIAGRRLRFMGSYKSPDLPSLMREVDWTIVPSTWWENAPVVIQEAFHHGRPIIASDIGGMAEKVRDGIDGLHFHVGNPESLAEAMTRAIREPELWDRLRAGHPPADLTAAAAARARGALRAAARAAGAGRSRWRGRPERWRAARDDPGVPRGDARPRRAAPPRPRSSASSSTCCTWRCRSTPSRSTTG